MNVKGRRQRRSCHNVCSRLLTNQVHIQTNGRTCSDKVKFFHTLKLSNILTQNALNEGHVFLGISGCNRFIISYTVTNTFPTATFQRHVMSDCCYTLHWWKSNFTTNITKVASVELFHNEIIKYELQLSYMEWPMDSSKIVVCGRCEIEDNLHYYVTVTATPSINKCEQCKSTILGNENHRCAQHGFAAHFSAQIPVSRQFRTNLLTRDSLKIPNIIVLNLSHQITALSISIGTDTKGIGIKFSRGKCQKNLAESTLDNYTSFSVIRSPEPHFSTIDIQSSSEVTATNAEGDMCSINVQFTGNLNTKCKQKTAGLGCRWLRIPDFRNKGEVCACTVSVDLEYTIFDILKHRWPGIYENGCILDYEATILDVCPEVHSILIHFIALVGQRYPIKADLARYTQIEYILDWSLTNGQYEIAAEFPNCSYNNKMDGTWNPSKILKTDELLRQKCWIKQRKTQILTNKSVHVGRSLEAIWNCDKTILISK